MESKAVLRYVRMAPRKARLVIDLIRGKNAEQAFTILKFSPRYAAGVIQKILKSAVANAAQKEMGDVDTLRVSRAFVDVGPSLKRVRPRAMGRANTILKRTSHITLVLRAEENNTKIAKPQSKKVNEVKNKDKMKNKRGVKMVEGKS
ncbi:50S ribosomal protein L22 [Nitrospira defluvii]|nr:50S ribosomal protein L22 [Nitrospira defluvii]